MANITVNIEGDIEEVLSAIRQIAGGGMGGGVAAVAPEESGIAAVPSGRRGHHDGPGRFTRRGTAAPSHGGVEYQLRKYLLAEPVGYRQTGDDFALPAHPITCRSALN